MKVLIFSSSCLLFASAGWVDPDTQEFALHTTSLVNGRTFDLVFSDEFEVEGRSFADGNDPRWTSMNKNDYTNAALQYYRDNLVTTNNGYLNISTVHEDISFKAFSATDSQKMSTMTKNYQSGMVQGWNKFCFTGGIVEVRAKLPGAYNIGGLWPAVWILGNLARATYVGSSNNMWPWSFDVCDRAKQDSQLISACNLVNHYNLAPSQGRGAPEIDLLEVMAGVENMAAAGLDTPINKPYLSSSLQVSPGITSYRPNTGDPPVPGAGWYAEGITYGQNTSLNIFFYGESLAPSLTQKDMSYVADAISGNSNIGETNFEDFHNYTIDWQSGPSGYINWYIDGEFIQRIDASALKLTGAIIPEEPMYLILNTAMSSHWGFVDPVPAGCGPNGVPCFDCAKAECSCACPTNLCSNFPANFLIDYVRVYQDRTNSDQIVGCSPPSHPTATFIEGNLPLYMNSPLQPGETVPILPVPEGGGACNHDDDCGTSAKMGTCQQGLCVCAELYTGPHCLASYGFDDQDWLDYDDDINISVLSPPAFGVSLVAIFGTTIAGVLAAATYKYYFDKANRGDFRLEGMGRYTKVDTFFEAPRR